MILIINLLYLDLVHKLTLSYINKHVKDLIFMEF